MHRCTFKCRKCGAAAATIARLVYIREKASELKNCQFGKTTVDHGTYEIEAAGKRQKIKVEPDRRHWPDVLLVVVKQLLFTALRQNYPKTRKAAAAFLAFFLAHGLTNIND